MNFRLFCAVVTVISAAGSAAAELTLKEIRTAANDTLVAAFSGEASDIEAVQAADAAAWKVNGAAASEVGLYIVTADPMDFNVYLRTAPLEQGKAYHVETPFGNSTLTFNDQETLCESIKVNQVAYSALASTRYALFSIWTGTGGAREIEGELPAYEVLGERGVIGSGKLRYTGFDESSGDHVYRMDLCMVPEGGPYRVSVDGYGVSHPFGVGAAFSKRLAYTIFRAQYLQRCGCPIENPPIREHACHTMIYDVDGPIGEANIEVEGTEPTLKVYGGYHDAGDADRRAYHVSNPMINLMIYEAFPDRFSDGQFDLPGKFDADYNIEAYENGIPDIIDEAAWGALAWEYLQNEDGSIHFGTETRGYPAPFAAPMDKDEKKYGTVQVDFRATCPAAGLFLHLARALKPHQPERAEELVDRARRAMAAGHATMADPERLYYNIQLYLLTGDAAAHEEVRAHYKVAATMKDSLTATHGYDLNNDRCDNPAYFLSYILEKERDTDSEIVDFFKQAIRDAADVNIAMLRDHAYPVGNPTQRGGWGHNVRQPQYACAPLLAWRLFDEQPYLDAACELMDYKLGLNPLGISYVTELGSHQVHNIHDRESSYTKSLGRGSKPGITAFGPGQRGRRGGYVLPAQSELSAERRFIDELEAIYFTEFTIFETMTHDALYTVLSGGGKWDGTNPYAAEAAQ